MRLFVLVLIFLFIPVRGALAKCTGPSGVEGEIVFNSNYNVPQYCDGSDNWIAMTGGEPTGPTGCPDIGDTCSDGSIYAGLSPDGSVPMYTTPADAASLYTWNDGSTNNVDTAMSNCGSTASCQTGEANTALLVGLSGSGTPAPYDAAEYCDGLTAHGYDDWYLPARDELNVLYTNKNTGNLNGTFNETGSYWSSSEFFSVDAQGKNFNSGLSYGFTKYSSLAVRCVRKQATNLTQIVPNGLIGHWRLDETSGTTAFDSSGNGNDGAMNNGLSGASDSVEGQVGNGLMFDNADDYIDLGDPAMILPSGNTRTVSAWVKPPEFSMISNSLRIFTIAEDTVTLMALAIEDTGHYRAIYRDSGGFADVVSAETYSGGRWRHILAVYDNSNVTLYVDGQVVATASDVDASTYGLGSGSSQTEIGGHSEGAGALYWDGSIDDVRLYDRALDAVEVTEIYQARDGIRYNGDVREYKFFDGNKYVSMTPEWADVTDGLVGHWKLDETEGMTALDSASSETGTLTGEPPASFDVGAVGPGSVRFYGANTTTSVALSGNQVFSAYDPYTISGWMKLESATFLNRAYAMYSTGTNSGAACNRHLMFGAGPYASANATYPFVRSYTSNLTSETMVSTNQLTVGEWVHVAFVNDGANINFYIDGELDGSVPYIQPFCEYSTPGSGGRIGSWSNDSGTFTTNGLIDDVRLYDRELSQGEIETLYEMGTPVGSSTALPQGCPNIGDVCDDGTIYAGLSSDDSVELFTTPEDGPFGLTWNDGNTDYTPTSTTDYDDGDGNTNTIVSTDSNSVAANFQAHNAAQYCYDLDAHGADDWYLPAARELRDSLCANQDVLPNLNVTGNSSSRYWSSMEKDISQTENIRFDTCQYAGDLKHLVLRHIRCVRKGPAPRCANPYGIEGQMVYNETYDVVQFCDGARWRAVGKYGP